MRYICTFLFLICTVLLKAQGDESFSVTRLSVPFLTYKEMEKMNSQKEYKQTVYWKKHKKLKRYAFGALGLGVCGTIVGWYGMIANSAYVNSDWENDGKVWGYVFVTGVGLTASSIPLFVVSYVNKKRAKKSVEYSLKSSNIHLISPNGRWQTQPAVGFCINF